jgi:hypothetical protein
MCAISAGGCRAGKGSQWWALVVLAVIVLQGCGTLERREAVPTALTEQAVTPGAPNSRYRLDRDIDPMVRDAVQAVQREKAPLAAAGKVGKPLPPANFLALSGGGDAGDSAPVTWSDGPQTARVRSSRW